MDPNQVSNSYDALDDADDPLADFIKVPGFLPRWEISHVLQEGHELYIEHAGKLDQIDVYRVYTRSRKPPISASEERVAGVGLPVALWVEGESASIPARLVPLSGDEPLLAVLSVDKRHAAVMSRIRSQLASSSSKPRAPGPFPTRRAAAPTSEGSR